MSYFQDGGLDTISQKSLELHHFHFKLDLAKTWQLVVHRIQNFAIRPDQDPCRILTCRIGPDPPNSPDIHPDLDPVHP